MSSRIGSVLLVLLAACNAEVVTGVQTSKGNLGTGSADGGTKDAGDTVTTTTSDSGDAGSPSCSQEVTEANAALGDVALLTSCQVDSDCTWEPTPTCLQSCGRGVVNQATAAALAPLVAQVNATICTPGCPSSEPPCVGGVGGPACLNGTCQVGIPTSWVSLLITDTGASTTTWTVTPDGTIVSSASGTKALSSADFATINGILTGGSLSQGPPTCDQGATSGDIQFAITRPNGISMGFDGTACVQIGPSGNVAQELYEVVETY
jgi:hypothetical protein